MKYESVIYVTIEASSDDDAVRIVDELKDELEGLHQEDDMRFWRGDVEEAEE